MRNFASYFLILFLMFLHVSLSTPAPNTSYYYDIFKKITSSNMSRNTPRAMLPLWRCKSTSFLSSEVHMSDNGHDYEVRFLWYDCGSWSWFRVIIYCMFKPHCMTGGKGCSMWAWMSMLQNPTSPRPGCPTVGEGFFHPHVYVVIHMT